jgi:carbonic anhydrase
MTANAKRIRLAATTLLLCTVVATSVSASCLHGTSHLPRQRREAEDPRTVAVSEFGYTGAQGPLNWAALSPDNAACSLSSVQSPINIDPSGSGPGVSPATVIPLQMTIPSVETAEFLNLGTTLEVEVNGTTAVDGQSFALKQFHFHTPSEHRIGEKYFSLEMHMVHDATGESRIFASSD